MLDSWGLIKFKSFVFKVAIVAIVITITIAFVRWLDATSIVFLVITASFASIIAITLTTAFAIESFVLVLAASFVAIPSAQKTDLLTRRLAQRQQTYFVS